MFALNYIKVLDLTRLLPGGICSLMLADQGAEVIKVEQPVMGDYARWYVPRVGDYAAVFHAMNRNKQSLALDLKTDVGRDILLTLVREADVLLESFRPQVIEKLDITYDTLRAINPRLVMCSLSGYGQTGELANSAAHDLNLAGISGVLAAGTSQVLPIQAMDFGGAYLAAFAIVTALFQRERTGEGAYIDAALLDAGISMMTLARAHAFAEQSAPKPAGEVLTGGYACYRVYRTQDDQPLVLAALEPKFWQTFCQLAGRDDLAQRNYLIPNEQPELIETVAGIIATKPLSAWLAILDISETCASPILDVIQAADQPQIQAREAWYLADGIAHTYTPFKMGQRVPHQPAPDLGQHTDVVLESAGFTAAQIATWRESGVIG